MTRSPAVHRGSLPAPRAQAAARFGGGGREGEYETVYTARSEPEAHVVRGRLEVEGIPAVVKTQLSDTLWAPAWPLHGIEVRVPRTLADRARTVLDNG
jgi:hypothetical protein